MMDSIQKTLKGLRPIVTYMLLVGCICNLLLLSTTIYVMQVFDRVLSSGSIETLLALTAITLFVLMLLAAIQAGRTWMLSKTTSWLEERMSDTVFEHAMHDKDLTTPLNTIRDYMTSQGFIALIDLPWSLLFIVVLFVLHVCIGFLAATGVVMVIAMAYLSYRYSREPLKNYQRHAGKSSAYLKNTRLNADDILRNTGDIDAVKVDWRRMNERAQTARLALAKRQAVLTEAGRFLRMFLQVAATGLGAYLVLKGELTIGGIIVGSTLLGRVLSPIETTFATWPHLLAAYRAYLLLMQVRDDDASAPFPEEKTP